MIVAPPGYGKSTLLCDWADRDERPFFWVVADERDPKASRRTAEPVLAAFVDAGWIEPAVAPTLTDLAARGLALLLPELVKSIALSRRDFVLAFEDAHLVEPGTLRKVVGGVLKSLPAGSMVAVSSRTEPPLPLGRLRAHRALVEVRTRDLAMAPAEAANLLRNAGMDLEFEQVQTLVRRTEGWPAALYLAALSLRDNADADTERERFAGDDHLLAEYLRDDVLSVMPSDLGEFLIRTSVLDELSAPVCDAVLKQRGSATALARLADLSQLLLPLDPAHQTYRWQRLFKDALRSQLRATEPELEPVLQLRASEWYGERGQIDRAIAHSVAAGDEVRSGELLWENIPAYLGAGRNDLVEGWLGGFGPERISESPSLALSAAYSALGAGDLAEAERWALTAAAALEADPASGEDGSLATGLALIETIAARDGAAAMRATAVRAQRLEPDHSQWRPWLFLMRGVAEHLTGERDEARRVLQVGADAGVAAAPMIACLCLAIDAMIALERHDWLLATELTDRARLLIDERNLDADPLSALAFAACAAVRAHEGRADEAKQDLRDGADLLAVNGDFIAWYGAEARILLAHASLWLADVVGARTLLAEASRLARRIPDAAIFERWFDEAWGYMDTLAEATLSGPSALTIAELRILRFLPSHRSFREIALQLGVSANTVKTQAHAVYRKLGAASRSEAVARAREAGLLGQ